MSSHEARVATLQASQSRLQPQSNITDLTDSRDQPKLTAGRVVALVAALIIGVPLGLFFGLIVGIATGLIPFGC